MANPQPVVTKPLDYAALVRKLEGKEWNKPDVAYEFSNGKETDSTDRTNSGLYE